MAQQFQRPVEAGAAVDGGYIGGALVDGPGMGVALLDLVPGPAEDRRQAGVGGDAPAPAVLVHLRLQNYRGSGYIVLQPLDGLPVPAQFDGGLPPAVPLAAQLPMHRLGHIGRAVQRRRQRIEAIGKAVARSQGGVNQRAAQQQRRHSRPYRRRPPPPPPEQRLRGQPPQHKGGGQAHQHPGLQVILEQRIHPPQSVLDVDELHAESQQTGGGEQRQREQGAMARPGVVRRFAIGGDDGKGEQRRQQQRRPVARRRQIDRRQQPENQQPGQPAHPPGQPAPLPQAPPQFGQRAPGVHRQIGGGDEQEQSEHPRKAVDGRAPARGAQFGIENLEAEVKGQERKGADGSDAENQGDEDRPFQDGRHRRGPQRHRDARRAQQQISRVVPAVDGEQGAHRHPQRHRKGADVPDEHPLQPRLPHGQAHAQDHTQSQQRKGNRHQMGVQIGEQESEERKLGDVPRLRGGVGGRRRQPERRRVGDESVQRRNHPAAAPEIKSRPVAAPGH